MRELLISSIWLAVLRCLGVLFQAGIVVFLTRNIPIEDMGIYAMVYALLSIVRFLGAFGTDQVALRRIAMEKESSLTPYAQQICDATLLISIVTGLLSTIGIGGYFFAIKTEIFNTYEIISICLSVQAFALIGILSAQIRGVGHNLAAQIPEAVVHHVVYACLLVMLKIFGIVDRMTVLMCLCLASWSVIFLYFRIRTKVGVGRLQIPGWALTCQVIKEGFTIFQAMAFTTLSGRLPIFLATGLIGPSAAAIIEISYRFGYIPSIITNSVGVTFSPQLAKISKQPDRAGLMKVLAAGSMLATIPAFLWLLLLVFGGRFLIGVLLPPAYADVYIPMMVVIVSANLNAAFTLASRWLLMSGAQAIVRRFSLLQLIVVFLGGVVLTKLFGVVGLAWALVVATLARDGGMFVYVITQQMGKTGKN